MDGVRRGTAAVRRRSPSTTASRPSAGVAASCSDRRWSCPPPRRPTGRSPSRRRGGSTGARDSDSASAPPSIPRRPSASRGCHVGRAAIRSRRPRPRRPAATTRRRRRAGSRRRPGSGWGRAPTRRRRARANATPSGRQRAMLVRRASRRRRASEVESVPFMVGPSLGVELAPVEGGGGENESGRQVGGKSRAGSFSRLGARFGGGEISLRPRTGRSATKRSGPAAALGDRSSASNSMAGTASGRLPAPAHMETAATGDPGDGRSRQRAPGLSCCRRSRRCPPARRAGCPRPSRRRSRRSLCPWPCWWRRGARPPEALVVADTVPAKSPEKVPVTTAPATGFPRSSTIVTSARADLVALAGLGGRERDRVDVQRGRRAAGAGVEAAHRVTERRDLRNRERGAEGVSRT